jgi:hypothetical protein
VDNDGWASWKWNCSGLVKWVLIGEHPHVANTILPPHKKMTYGNVGPTLHLTHFLFCFSDSFRDHSLSLSLSLSQTSLTPFHLKSPAAIPSPVILFVFRHQQKLCTVVEYEFSWRRSRVLRLARSFCWETNYAMQEKHLASEWRAFCVAQKKTQRLFKMINQWFLLLSPLQLQISQNFYHFKIFYLT